MRRVVADSLTLRVAFTPMFVRAVAASAPQEAVFHARYGLGMPPLDFGWPNWGDLPTWGAFIGATIAVYFTWQAIKMQRNQERKFQAEKFACWINTVDDNDEPMDRFQLILRNASDLPIYDCRVTVFDLIDNKQVGAMSFGSVKPGQRSRYLPEEVENAVRKAKTKTASPSNLQRFGVSVQFNDTRGNSWRRNVSGVLR